MKISDKQNTGSYQSSEQSHPMRAKATEAGIPSDTQEPGFDKVTLSNDAEELPDKKPRNYSALSKKIALYIQNQALV
jgi:hypothetical protein